MGAVTCDLRLTTLAGDDRDPPDAAEQSAEGSDGQAASFMESLTAKAQVVRKKKDLAAAAGEEIPSPLSKPPRKRCAHTPFAQFALIEHLLNGHTMPCRQIRRHSSSFMFLPHTYLALRSKSDGRAGACLWLSCLKS